MVRLPPPVPPPVRHAELDELDLDVLDDEHGLAKTVERKSVRITTARFASVAPCVFDVVPAPSSTTSPPSPTSPASPLARLRSALPAALLEQARAALGAAVWLACVMAGITGVLVGHAGHARPSHAASPALALATETARAPRVAVVVEASEEITQLAIVAPGKVVESPTTEATQAAARPLRRQGFGHMGADRTASGAATRRAAPHRR
ncbi:MAG: hypothetical protein NVS3B10_03370 [Polyangiales bacterium]